MPTKHPIWKAVKYMRPDTPYPVVRSYEEYERDLSDGNVEDIIEFRDNEPLMFSQGVLEWVPLN